MQQKKCRRIKGYSMTQRILCKCTDEPHKSHVRTSVVCTQDWMIHNQSLKLIASGCSSRPSDHQSALSSSWELLVFKG